MVFRLICVNAIISFYKPVNSDSGQMLASTILAVPWGSILRVGSDAQAQEREQQVRISNGQQPT